MFQAKQTSAVVSKKGVNDGNKKGEGFLQPAKENYNYYST